MKKHLIDLQMFAEDTPPAAGEPSGNEPQGTEPQGGAEEKKEEKVFTHAEFNRLFNQKYAELEQKKQKELDEAKKLAEMNAQEKAEYELKREKESHAATQKELDEYKRKDSLAEMTKTARKMLADSGITIPDELLGMMVTAEAEETKAAVDGFAKAFTEAVEAAVKERLKGEPPRKGTGGTPTMSKEQIMEIKDPELRQQKMLEHKHLFNF